MLPYDGAEKVNGSIIVKTGYTWERVNFVRDSALYDVVTNFSKSGKRTAHKATMDVLTTSANEVHRFIEKCRTRHLLALVLNSGETLIAGIYAPMRMKIEPTIEENPEGIVGFTLKFDCESRSDKETFVLAFAPPAKKPLLYNGYAVNDIRGIAPTGWHIPTKEEFETLIAYLGGEFVAGGKLKKIGSDYWIDPNVGATDEVGFGLTGNGYRDSSGYFQNLKAIASLWTITTGDFFGANFAYMVYASYTVIQLHFRDHTNATGYAIRAIKNDSTNTGTVTDKDGNVYPTVKIGEQVWMAEDLCVKHYNNGDPIPNITDNTEWAALTTGACCTYNNE